MRKTLTALAAALFLILAPTAGGLALRARRTVR